MSASGMSIATRLVPPAVTTTLVSIRRAKSHQRRRRIDSVGRKIRGPGTCRRRRSTAPRTWSPVELKMSTTAPGSRTDPSCVDTTPSTEPVLALPGDWAAPARARPPPASGTRRRPTRRATIADRRFRASRCSHVEVPIVRHLLCDTGRAPCTAHRTARDGRTFAGRSRFVAAAFVFRLLFGLSSELFFEDETQIFLIGLRYYATGSWPFFGPDVVWTKSEIPGALQGLLVGAAVRVLPHSGSAVRPAESAVGDRAGRAGVVHLRARAVGAAVARLGLAVHDAVDAAILDPHHQPVVRAPRGGRVLYRILRNGARRFAAASCHRRPASR